MLLQIDFLQYQPALRLRQNPEGVREIHDPIRKKWMVLTPEELLRQLTLQYLLQEKQYPITRIRSEIGIRVNGMPRRCDIVVFDAKAQPWLLVECKSPKVALTQAVMDQAARYNLTLGVPYIVVTNGLHTSCCEIRDGEVSFLGDLPVWG